MKNDKIIILCCHCGNVSPHFFLYQHTSTLLYDEFEDNEKIYEKHPFELYKCETCSGITLLGGFEFESDPNKPYKRLYPRGALMLPEAHLLDPSEPIPLKILNDYEEIWPLRHRAPNAFVSQIRRLLEAVCLDKGAKRKTLISQLKELREMGYLPDQYIELANLLRSVGNIGAHAGDREISVWDAEIVDELFQELINYVYISPAKLARLKKRMSK